METERLTEPAEESSYQSNRATKRYIEGTGFVLVGVSLLLTGIREAAGAVTVAGGALLVIHGLGRMQGQYVTLLRGPEGTTRGDRTEWVMLGLFVLGAVVALSTTVSGVLM